jgi:hypothetical protein
VSTHGTNLPEFQAEQLAFAAYIRNPEIHPVPAGIETRRMNIYAGLFYRNIEGFLASGFPVTKKIHQESGWQGTSWSDLVRSFLHRHASESPYFLEISQEFLQFMSIHEEAARFPWLLELMHYEWVELALGVSAETLPDPVPTAAAVGSEAGLFDAKLMVSPLAWSLAYRYPVHHIGPDHLPERAPARPTLLVVYRRHDDTVHFMESSPMTHRLLELIRSGSSGDHMVEQIATESGLNVDIVREKALGALSKLRDMNIILFV